MHTYTVKLYSNSQSVFRHVTASETFRSNIFILFRLAAYLRDPAEHKCLT